MERDACRSTNLWVRLLHAVAFVKQNLHAVGTPAGAWATGAVAWQRDVLGPGAHVVRFA